MRPPDKQKSTPARDRGASKIDNVGTSNDDQKYNLENPFIQGQSPREPALTLIPQPSNVGDVTEPNWISTQEACELSGEKPATIIAWCVHHKIGRHVKSGRGHGGEWLVDPDALQRLLAERAAA